MLIPSGLVVPSGQPASYSARTSLGPFSCFEPVGLSSIDPASLGAPPPTQPGPSTSSLIPGERVARAHINLPAFPGWEFWDGHQNQQIVRPNDVRGILVNYDYVFVLRYHDLLRMVGGLKNMVITDG